MKKGRIGVGKRVHIIEKQEGDYAIAKCGWSGQVRPTIDPVTCVRCKNVS